MRLLEKSPEDDAGLLHGQWRSRMSTAAEEIGTHRAGAVFPVCGRFKFADEEERPCREATRAHTPTNRNGKPSTSKKDMRVGASAAMKPSVARGRRSTPRRTAEKSRAPGAAVPRITSHHVRAATSVARARATPNAVAPRRKGGRRESVAKNGGTVERERLERSPFK